VPILPHEVKAVLTGWELLYVLVVHPEHLPSWPNNISKQHLLKRWKTSYMRIRRAVLATFSMLTTRCINNCPFQDKNHTILSMNLLRSFRSMLEGWTRPTTEVLQKICEDKRFSLSWLKKHINRSPTHWNYTAIHAKLLSKNGQTNTL